MGHSTVLISLGGVALLTDPLLRSPMLGALRRRAGVGIGDVPAPDGVLISHLHHDHLDLPSLRRLGGSTPLAGPPGTEEFLGAKGFADVRDLAPGDTWRIAGVEVSAVEARHQGGRSFTRSAAGSVGFVLAADGARVYFAGDTDLFPGMAELGPGIDVALLPIWGWGPTLGDGHLDPARAARAAALIRPRVAVPIHWGSLAPLGASRLWPWLLERPAERFADEMARTAPSVQVAVLHPGEALPISGGAA